MRWMKLLINLKQNSMALKKRIMVNLIETKAIDFIGRDGEKVSKIKHTFLTPEQEIIHGYLDKPREEYKGKEIDTHEFIESKAIETFWVGKEYQGQTTWRLV